MNKAISKLLIEKLFTVKKQLNIQKVIDKLYLAHGLPTANSRALFRLGNTLIRLFKCGKDDELKFQKFLELAKKEQSFESNNSTLPPLLKEDDTEVLDNPNNNDVQNDKNMDNKQEGDTQ